MSYKALRTGLEVAISFFSKMVGLGEHTVCGQLTNGCGTWVRVEPGLMGLLQQNKNGTIRPPRKSTTGLGSTLLPAHRVPTCRQELKGTAHQL